VLFRSVAGYHGAFELQKRGHPYMELLLLTKAEKNLLSKGITLDSISRRQVSPTPDWLLEPSLCITSLGPVIRRDLLVCANKWQHATKATQVFFRTRWEQVAVSRSIEYFLHDYSDNSDQETAEGPGSMRRKHLDRSHKKRKECGGTSWEKGNRAESGRIMCLPAPLPTSGFRVCPHCPGEVKPKRNEQTLVEGYEHIPLSKRR